MAKNVIVISGPAGVGKSTLAMMISKKYKTKFYTGSEFFKEIARGLGYNPVGKDWWDTKEGLRFLRERGGNPEIDREVDKIMIRKVNEGNAVVTSWTLPYLGVDGVKIFITASPEERARRISRRDRIPFGKAMKIIKERDGENEELYKKIYGFDIGKDLKAFDFVLNTDRMSAKEVMNAVVEFIETKKIRE
ncbi:MAG: cytidylate kinase family protein [Candidatus Aenigmarchaeota archaeon]|nr:cytidylate kinase family protein [Candidatus Aenigmarchaeota archaeon]